MKSFLQVAFIAIVVYLFSLPILLAFGARVLVEALRVGWHIGGLVLDWAVE